MEIMILNSTRENGIMSEQAQFYPGMTSEEIKADLLKRRERLGELHGFCGTNIIVPKQTPKYPGQLYDATEFVCDYVKPGTDLWDTNEPCDVMLLRDEAFKTVPGLVLAYPVSDCPVFIVRAKKTLSIVHCGGAQIDRELPIIAIEAIREKVDAQPDDINIYVGPYAQPGSYVYDSGTPEYAKNNKVWDDCLIQKGNLVYVDMKHAIEKQIYKKYFRYLNFSELDTVKDEKFYSNCAGVSDPTKRGRNLVGVYCKTAHKSIYE